MSRVSSRLYTYADLRYAADNGIFNQKYAFEETSGRAVTKADTLDRMYVKAAALPDDRMPTWDDLVASDTFSCSSTTRTLDDVGYYTWETHFDVGTTSGVISADYTTDMVATNCFIQVLYEGVQIFSKTVGTAESGTIKFTWTYNSSSILTIRYFATYL